MKLWAIYSDSHPEVDIYGDRDGLRLLASAMSQADRSELPLDAVPLKWQEFGYAVTLIRVEPSEAADPRICFGRDGSVWVVSGSSRELSRIVGSSISNLADGPQRSHLHLDPTSDPDRRFYSPNSGSVVVGFEPNEGR
jgi:hypothetical protein